jgi:aquaglyceroporin related protein
VTEQNGPQPPFPTHSMVGRRQQTTADFRPPPLQHGPSTASSIGRYASTRLGTQNHSQSRPSPERHTTAPTRMRRTGTSTTNQSTQPVSLVDTHERAEKPQQQTVDIENNYFALNPWYNQQKPKPVFGLAAPLPRTVRKGMWWGRGDLKKSLYKVDEEQDDDGIDKHDALDYQKNDGKSLLHCTPHQSHTYSPIQTTTPPTPPPPKSPPMPPPTPNASARP